MIGYISGCQVTVEDILGVKVFHTTCHLTGILHHVRILQLSTVEHIQHAARNVFLEEHHNSTT